MLGLVTRPVVLWDEPEQLRSAAQRLWKRLEDPERPSPVPAERVFLRWEELEEQAAGAPRWRCGN